MKKKKIVFPALVKTEAKNLRKLATKEEKLELFFDRLLTSSRVNCIYGQLTGDCFSQRAEELIKNCAPRVYHSGEGTPGSSKKLNGNPKKTVRRKNYEPIYWSPIEVFIDRPGNQTNGANERLVKYIKGEIRTL